MSISKTPSNLDCFIEKILRIPLQNTKKENPQKITKVKIPSETTSKLSADFLLSREYQKGKTIYIVLRENVYFKLYTQET
jgi:hypothetical protein